MSKDTVKGISKASSSTSPYNALHFVVNTLIKNKVNTAIPVRVDSVSAGGASSAVGYVSATPLVCQTDANNNILAPDSLPQLPYCRIQGGAAAIVCDPKPGDIGIAVFSKRDISNVGQGNTNPVPPGSFRQFSEGDGMYIGGILNQAPSVYVELDPDSGTVTIKAPTKIVLDSPLVEVKGAIVQTGESGESASFKGGMSNSGGQVSSNGIVLDSHTHPDAHGGNTGKPN